MAWSRRRLIVAAVATVLAMAAGVPIVAYVVVPLFVRSTVYEPPPSPAPVATVAASAESSASPPVAALRGELRRVDAVHYGRGRVVLDGGNLRFEDVEIAAAPNMYVYLSDRDDGSPGHFVDLGPLRATNGSFNYSLPAGVAPGSVRSVVVWCRAFSVTVTYAVLAS